MEKIIKQVKQLMLEGADVLLFSGEWDEDALGQLSDIFKDKYPDSKTLMIILPPDGDLRVISEKEMKEHGWVKEGTNGKAS